MPTAMTVTLIGTAPVTNTSESWDVNDSGLVVGQEDTVFPFVWRPNSPNGTTGSSTRLPCLLHPVQGIGVATAINSAGDVVGFCETVDAGGTTVTHAVVWRGGAGPAIDLGTLVPNLAAPGTFLGDSKAFDINDNGFIVGESTSVSGVSHAFLFDPNVGAMRDLFSLVPSTMLPGTSDPSVAKSISANGAVVGSATAVDSQGNLVHRAFLIPSGAIFMSDLGTLFPDPNVPGTFSGNSSAMAISVGGTIVGDSETSSLPNSSTGAFFASGAAPLGMFPAQMTVLHCNDQDQIVGAMGSAPSRAFRFSSGAAPIDLSGTFVGHTIVRAAAINNIGQIAAIANDGASDKAVLLTP
jgi:probable HAF family extracellular repeat protein